MIQRMIEIRMLAWLKRIALSQERIARCMEEDLLMRRAGGSGNSLRMFYAERNPELDETDESYDLTQTDEDFARAEATEKRKQLAGVDVKMDEELE
jgi:hypothetical protein